MIRFTIDNNITDLIKWAKQIPGIIGSQEIAKRCAEKFVKRAQDKLRHSGALQEDIERFANAITCEQISANKWRISAGAYGDNQLREDMYYLEFGTGIVGKENPHPQATINGWYYNGKDGNKYQDFHQAVSKDGNLYTAGGWTFRRGIRYGNQNAFIAKDDIVHRYKRSQHKGATTGWSGLRRVRQQDHAAGSDKSIQTKGVIAVKYFYDTMADFDKILNEVFTELGI